MELLKTKETVTYQIVFDRKKNEIEQYLCKLLDYLVEQLHWEDKVSAREGIGNVGGLCVPEQYENLFEYDLLENARDMNKAIITITLLKKEDLTFCKAFVAFAEIHKFPTTIKG